MFLRLALLDIDRPFAKVVSSHAIAFDNSVSVKAPTLAIESPVEAKAFGAVV